MKSRIYSISLFLLCLSLAASCDYLDKREETEGLSEEEVFTNAQNYEGYVDWMVQNAVIRHFKNGTTPDGSFDDISDNTMTSIQYTSPTSLAASGDYLTMLQNGRCSMCNNDLWTRIWQYIRVANNGIVHIGSYPGSEQDRNRILGTCYFYRAYVYFEICRRWGGMPYFREPLDLAENLDFARDDMRTTYLNIAADFAEAAKLLPPTVAPAQWQHPTSVAALAFRARTLLYAASPQATLEGGKSRENLWREAAVACDEAIKAAEDNGYALADGSDYYYIFKGENYDVYTKEVLWGRRAFIEWGSNAYKVTIRPPGRLSGTNGIAANQKFVDCFDMTNGYPISDPKSGYNPQNPYVDRGLRFEHNILYNGASAFGSRFSGKNAMKLYHQEEGNATLGGGDITFLAGAVAAGFTKTGTYCIKLMGNEWQKRLYQVWPYIRMAELYLNFAEAAAEAGWDIKTASNGARYAPLEALNKVRNRAEIADLPEEYQTAVKFKERVQNERREELCMEDHRFFDIRRLLIGTTEDHGIYGVFVTKLKTDYDKKLYPTGYKYEYPETPVLPHIYEDRHNLFPINRDDTFMGPLFNQNPGWE